MRPSDLHGLALLTTRATLGLTDLVEHVHQTVLRSVAGLGGRETDRTRGITGFVYRAVRAVTRGVGGGAAAGLGALAGSARLGAEAEQAAPQREALLGVLNGVVGDRLAAHGNPLALPMTLRDRHHAPYAPDARAASPKLLVLVHGLCMTDRGWRDAEGGGHGEALAAHRGYTPVYVRYNSGRHIAENGRALAAHLERLVAGWPVPLEQVVLLGHSMGGLVSRSAVHYAQADGMRWPERLDALVSLGTPHLGAPLERGGNWIDMLLGSTPFSAPFARLGHVRSAGITDLRWGHVLDDDRIGRDRFDRRDRPQRYVPLPDGVACYAVAATTAAVRGGKVRDLVGDGLVPVSSALGQHPDPQRHLGFEAEAQCVVTGTSHLDLLTSEEVKRQLIAWL